MFPYVSLLFPVVPLPDVVRLMTHVAQSCRVDEACYGSVVAACSDASGWQAALAVLEALGCLEAEVHELCYSKNDRNKIGVLLHPKRQRKFCSYSFHMPSLVQFAAVSWQSICLRGRNDLRGLKFWRFYNPMSSRTTSVTTTSKWFHIHNKNCQHPLESHGNVQND